MARRAELRGGMWCSRNSWTALSWFKRISTQNPRPTGELSIFPFGRVCQVVVYPVFTFGGSGFGSRRPARTLSEQKFLKAF